MLKGRTTRLPVRFTVFRAIGFAGLAFKIHFFRLHVLSSTMILHKHFKHPYFTLVNYPPKINKEMQLFDDHFVNLSYYFISKHGLSEYEKTKE